jgi:hypothetical protein
VTVSLINAMGAMMVSELSKPNTGLFDFTQAPPASYSLLASSADPALVVTTPNPQPAQLATNEQVTGIQIGVMFQSVETRNNDGILDRDEDLNRDANFTNDDSDGDGLPNYRDADDDLILTPSRPRWVTPTVTN